MNNIIYRFTDHDGDEIMIERLSNGLFFIIIENPSHFRARGMGIVEIPLIEVQNLVRALGGAI